MTIPANAQFSNADQPPRLYVDLSGGAAFTADKGTIADGTDLKKPAAKANQPSFSPSSGTTLNLGTGVKFSNGLSLGVEGVYIGHNLRETALTHGGVTYDMTATATSLGALATTGFELDFGSDFGLETSISAGVFNNSTTGEVTKNGIKSKFGNNTRSDVGYGLGLGLTYAPSDESQFAIEYRYTDAGKANSGRDDLGANSVIDFGTLRSHSVLFGAQFQF